MSYFSDRHSHSVRFSGEETDITPRQGGATPLGRFSNETSILFGRIEDQEVESRNVSADFPINLFNNVRTFRVSPCDEKFVEETPCTDSPSPSLREIRYSFWLPPTPHKATHKSSAERELVGYQPELVRISIAEKKISGS